MKYLLLFCLCGTLLSPVWGGNLLAVHFVATGSYIRIMNGVLEALAPHHKITLYSIVHEEPPHPNVTLIKVKAPQANNFFFTGLFDYLCTYGQFYVGYKAMHSVEPQYIEALFSDPNAKQILASRGKYDAFITFSTFSEFLFQLAPVLDAPLIEISPPVPFTHVNDAVGNPTFMSTVNSFYDYCPGVTFLQRVMQWIKKLEVHLRFNYNYIPILESATSKIYPPGTPGIAEAHRNTSLLIANQNDAMGHARPNMPHVVNIGGIHCRPPRPLDKDLEDFIQGSGEHGIIYFSFGSSIRSQFPEYIKQSVIRVFSKLPQRVLWKWNEEISNLPPNVRVSKWYSQQDILGHNKTKLFITQSGLFSMEETSYHGVPVLAIPIAFDQPMNAHIAQTLGYCEYISFCEFSEDKFYELVQKLLLDPRYRQSVKRVSKLMRDEPMSASQRLVWWVDYVVRHKGNPMISSMKDKSYGLERLDLDVITFIYVSITIALLVCVYFIYVIKKYLEAFFAKKDVDTEPKKKSE